MEDKLVSVIMPAYNAEKYIGMAIESVMKQTYKNVELVIVNDASTDNTLKIICQYADIWHDKIKFSSRKLNGGTAAALNDAIALVEGGEYISWLSADDLYCEDMIESEVNYLKQNKQYDAVFSRCAYIDADGMFKYEQGFGEYEGLINLGMAGIVHFLLHMSFWHGCSLLAKAECFKCGEGFNVNYMASQDYDFWLRLAADYDIGYLDKVNVLSRVHSEQGSRKLNCDLDAIQVFFNILCREDIMLKLCRKMNMKYTYESIFPYIEYRIKKYERKEVEMNALAQGLRKYMNMMESGQIHYQS